MVLMLEVTGPEADRLGAARRKEFDGAGGTIGRLPDNAWVLPDAYVSSRHALIKYQNGVFFIEDTSTNGVFINSPDNRLTPGQPYALNSGDWIFIDPYEIRAEIAARPASSVQAPLDDDPFGLAGPHHFGGSSSPANASPAVPASLAPLESLVPGGGGEDVDPLSLLGFGPKPAAPPNVPTAADLARQSLLTEHYQPPAVPAAPAPPQASEGGLIPDDYDPLSSDSAYLPLPRGVPQPGQRSPARPDVAPQPERSHPAVDPVAAKGGPRSRPAVGVRTPPPQSTPAAAAGGGVTSSEPAAMSGAAAGLDAVLAGAGLKGVPVTPELAQAVGEILRVVVAGVMDVLQARQRIKNEFRMRQTSFRPAANNPLKFSANVDDALDKLLVKRNAGYLGPVEAFEDAFDDLRNHQVATLAGVRVAFEAMLAEFDPERLQGQFDRHVKKGSIISVPAKLRYWEQYRERFSDMVRDPDSSFRRLFGDEFTKAYEEQLDRLKAHGRAGKR